MEEAVSSLLSDLPSNPRERLRRMVNPRRTFKNATVAMYKVLSDASAEAIALVVWAAFWVCVWIECMRAIVLLEMNVRVVESVVEVEGMKEVLVVGASVVRVRSK